MPEIAFVTCRVLPEPDPDEAPLLAACREAGLVVEMAAWDSSVDWSRYDLAVLRSCWNYYEDPVGFKDWLDRVSFLTKLWNSPDTVRGNMDKRYLARLADRGIPIVPTRYLSSDFEVAEAVAELGCDRFVIKPTISAASYMTRRFVRDQVEGAQSFACTILASRGAMLQPYLESVESGGEVSLVHIEGVLTHAVVKHPRFNGGDESVSLAFQPDAAQSAAASRVMATVEEPCMYARVDLMKSSTGDWLLSELELIEPSLFLAQHPPALARYVQALGVRC